MAKDFNIYTYPTFSLLLVVMLIPFALSVDDIMNNDQSNMKMYLLLYIVLGIQYVYSTRMDKVIITQMEVYG